MPQRTREQIIAFLDQCGNLDYNEMVDFIQSVLFYYEADGSGGPPPKFFGLWDEDVAATNVYDFDTYVSYQEKIYRSVVADNQSIPGVNGDWILQGEQPIPDPVEFQIGDGQSGTPAVNTLAVTLPILQGRKVRLFRDGVRKGTRQYAAGDGYQQPTSQGVMNVTPAWQPNEWVIIEIYK